MRNGAALLVIAGVCALAGYGLDAEVWRLLLLVALAVVGYFHGRHLPVRRGWAWLSVAALGGVVGAVVDFWAGFSSLLCLTVFVALPWLAGQFRRQQAELIVAGQQRVEQMEREQEFVAERARLRERARIAADMHDSLGHDLALIALRAGSLELAPEMAEANQQAAAELRATAVAATDRLRQTIGMLRENGTPSVEPPDESVEVLVDRARSAGMAVSLLRSGEPLAVPPEVDRAAHRVVQEALTNAARYAPGAEVTVRVERIPNGLNVIVRNSAVDAPPVLDGGNGSGLLALAERVRLLGGTFRAEPGDGFTVTARLSCPAVPATKEDE
ncbi:histidine kinase [Saccharopolyspora sp. NPDC050642]|uniref:sensor histidine kinase n=1 Tax=Saccharopolyspora sp. NPDC050642 TaxID=3157099 RepID=UPI0033FF1FD6